MRSFRCWNICGGGARIWCPFDKEDSAFVKVFKLKGFDVIRGHIDEGQDFFFERVPECDYIISNPPYSKRDEILKRLYAIGKPFAMLLNYAGIFDSKSRFRMFKRYGVELLLLSPRVKYYNDCDEWLKSPPFQSCYICNGILNERIIFKELNELALYQTSLFGES